MLFNWLAWQVVHDLVHDIPFYILEYQVAKVQYVKFETDMAMSTQV